MKLVCKKNLTLGLLAFGNEHPVFIKNKTYKSVELKEDVVIMESERKVTVGFKKFKNQVHKFAPNFIWEYFSFNPENTRFVIVEKSNYSGQFF